MKLCLGGEVTRSGLQRIGMAAISVFVFGVIRLLSIMRCFYPVLLFTSMRRIKLYSYIILMNDNDDNTYPKNEQVSPFWLP